jgi:hypothetical protein
MDDPVLDQERLALPCIDPARDRQLGAELAGIAIGRAGFQ